MRTQKKKGPRRSRWVRRPRLQILLALSLLRAEDAPVRPARHLTRDGGRPVSPDRHDLHARSSLPSSPLRWRGAFRPRRNPSRSPAATASRRGRATPTLAAPSTTVARRRSSAVASSGCGATAARNTSFSTLDNSSAEPAALHRVADGVYLVAVAHAEGPGEDLYLAAIRRLQRRFPPRQPPPRRPSPPRRRSPRKSGAILIHNAFGDDLSGPLEAQRAFALAFAGDFSRWRLTADCRAAAPRSR